MAGSGVALTGPLLEREEEADSIARLLAGAADGRGAAVVLEGAAGIGKTSLIDAARHTAQEYKMEILSARGGELERDFAYGVVRQLLEPALASAGEEQRGSLLDGAAALAAPLLGFEAGAAGNLPAGDPTAAAMHGLYWLTANLAGSSPILVAVDDLHWVDVASLRFLAYLARRVGELPIVLLAASRPPVESHAPELVNALGTDPGVLRIVPSPLTRAAVVELTDRALGRAAADRLGTACHQATGGNPFLIQAILQAVAERGEGAVTAETLPEVGSRAIVRTVAQRLARLGDGPGALARAVAVLGTDAEPRRAHALAGLDESQAYASESALIGSGVLAPGRPLEFVHPLVRAAVAEQLLPPERAVKHLAAARMLAEERDDPERVAPHLLASDARADPWVVDMLRRAARRSTQRGAPDAAVRYLRRALDEPPPPGLRGTLLAELGGAEVRAAMPDEAVGHLEAALEVVDDPRERAAMAHDMSLGLIAPGRYSEGVAMLERAAEEMEAVDPELALGLEAELLTAAMLTHETSGVRKKHIAHANFDLNGDTRGERMLLASLCFEVMLKGEDSARASAMARRAVDGGLLQDVQGDSGLWINIVFTLTLADEFALAEHALDTALDDIRARGSVIGFVRNSCFRAILRYRRGDVADAETDARRCIEVGSEPGYNAARMAYSPLIEALIEQGETDAADRALREAGLDHEIPDNFMLNFVLHSRGWLRLAQGRVDDALGDFDLLEQREQDWRSANPACFPYRSGIALAAMRLGDRDGAREVASEELELSRRWGTKRAIGFSLRTLGLARAGSDGIEMLRESASTLDGSGAWLEHARSLVELGAALRRSGKRSDARDPLHHGMEMAYRCGAAALVERALDELRAAGARPRRIMRTGIDALTASERRVAAMAADGMTNREIAQALFVTMRTVEVHLTHAYQKLAIRSRDQLPQVLAG